MRVALLVLTLTMASLAGSLGAGAEFNCFETPGEGVRCACIGASDCSEMRNSGSCKSVAECDKGELGATICSCAAARSSRALGRRPMLLPCSHFRRFSTPTASADQRVLDFLSDSLLSRSRELPLWVDAVEKLSDTQRAGNNRIQFLHFFESMLRASLVS
jgi:hypothetical protein